MKSIAFGEILWDIVDDKQHLGGAPLNFAAHLAKANAESYIISKVGNDDLGIRAIAEVRKNKVITTYIEVDKSYETGTAHVIFENGHPDYLIKKGVAYDHISEAQIPADFDETHIFYFGTLTQRSEKSRNTLYKILNFSHFEFVFYDVNLRKDCFSKDSIDRSFGYANVIKLNRNEVDIIANLLFNKDMSLEDFLEQCRKSYNPKIIIITDGANGCYVYEDGKLNHVPGKQVMVKDAIGTGDSFSAAFMYKYFRTRDAIISAATANEVGAFVATQNGAIPEYSQEIQARLQQ